MLSAPVRAAYDAHENIIAGNVALYGATSGEAYIAGMAGERFAVRNSGAEAVVEGVGEHGCEYMTGGCVVVLGPTGKNFAAGMSGGIAYVLDEDNRLYRNLNHQLVRMEEVTGTKDRENLRRLLKRHAAYTGSEKAKQVLAHFEEVISHFKKIIPADYSRMLELMAQAEAKGADQKTAKIEAFEAFISEEASRA